MAKSPREFYDIHNSILSVYNEVVLNFSAFTIVEYKIHSRNYFLKAPNTRRIIGGSHQTYQIDQIDFDILKLLALDSRISILEISERIKVTAAIVTYRIDRLEKLGIIIGYHLALNLEELGLDHFKVQFFLRSYELALRNQFVEYCNRNPNVIFYIEQLGDCNVELELEVSGYREYADIIDEIRGEYSKLIRNFNTMLIRKNWYSPMPEDIAGLGLEAAA
ncbi:MAG: Lrp/AsnC family transcriptional regulator [bacterium]|nr:Lrp/AsnC family transcriptional regulator [bacterium]